ncbi:hypothetical protein CapIbe_006004 [Capra ibex]
MRSGSGLPAPTDTTGQAAPLCSERSVAQGQTHVSVFVGCAWSLGTLSAHLSSWPPQMRALSPGVWEASARAAWGGWAQMESR